MGGNQSEEGWDGTKVRKARWNQGEEGGMEPR